MSALSFVIPAKAGIQSFPGNALRAVPFNALGPRLRGDDGRQVAA